MNKCPRCSCEDKIGIEITGAFDGVLFWRCLACDMDYHRWPESFTDLRERAEKHMQERDGGDRPGVLV